MRPVLSKNVVVNGLIPENFAGLNPSEPPMLTASQQCWSRFRSAKFLGIKPLNRVFMSESEFLIMKLHM